MLSIAVTARFINRNRATRVLRLHGRHIDLKGFTEGYTGGLIPADAVMVLDTVVPWCTTDAWVELTTC